MTVKICKRCGSDFPAKPTSSVRYCSSECRVAAWRSRSLPVRDRLLAKLNTDGDCWTWAGRRNEFGYGVTVVGSRSDGSRRTVLAHRAMWSVIRGPIPDGLHVLHTCDNPPCCNPEHLFLGTPAVNQQDKIQKGRWRGGEGDRHPTARRVDIQRVREEYARTGSVNAAARAAGVTWNTAKRVLDGRHWSQRAVS